MLGLLGTMKRSQRYELETNLAEIKQQMADGASLAKRSVRSDVLCYSVTSLAEGLS